MWPNPKELWTWSYLLKKSLMENFIFCAVLQEEYQDNFDGEIEVKQVKIIGCHVPLVPVPEQFAHLHWSFVQSFKKHCCAKGCPRFL